MKKMIIMMIFCIMLCMVFQSVNGYALIAHDVANPEYQESGSNYSYIGFGRSKTGKVKDFRVLDTKGNNGNSNALFMLLEVVSLDVSNKSGGTVKEIVKNQLNDELNGADRFTDMERGAILSTTKSESGNLKWCGTSNAEAAGLSAEKLFLLSAQEATNRSYGFKGEAGTENNVYKDPNNWKTKSAAEGYIWPLRSKCGDGTAVIDWNGYSGLTANGSDKYLEIRYALNIDLTKVVCTIPSKSSYDKTIAFTKLEKRQTKPSNVLAADESKLVLLDSGRSGFAATATVEGRNINVEYSNAKTGSNEYISAITQKKGSSDYYYGTFKLVDAATGNLTIAFPKSMTEGDYNLWILNEQKNTSGLTNCAGYKQLEVKIEDMPPKNEITFKLGTSSSSGDVGNNGASITISSVETTTPTPIYRYDQEIKCEWAVTGSDNVASVKFNGVDKGTTLSGSEVICSKGGQYTDAIKNKSYSLYSKSGAGKEATVSISKLSDYIKKHHRIDATEVPTSEFNAYIKDGEVVIRFKMTYGQEFLKGISKSKSTSSSDYVSKSDSRVKVIAAGSGDYNQVLEVRTKNKPNDSQKVYLHYDKNDGTDGWQELTYTLGSDLSQGYRPETDVISQTEQDLSKLQVFDLSKGNLRIEKTGGKIIAHYGKKVSGITATEDTDESTVECKEAVLLKGTTTQYSVLVEADDMTLVLDDGLSITSSTTSPIRISNSVVGDTKIVLVGGGMLKSTSSNPAIKVEGGTFNLFRRKDKTGTFNIESTNGGGIEGTGSSTDINIFEVFNTKITASGGAAAIGTARGGSMRSIYVLNSSLEINVTGGGAGIGTGENGTVTEVNVEGTRRNNGSDQALKITVDTGACIGTGKSGRLTNTLDGLVVNDVKGEFKTGDSGVAIGSAGSGANCGNIEVDYLYGTVSNAKIVVGAGDSAQCGDIRIEGVKLNITKCTVGVGAGQNATCGGIIITLASEIKISQSSIGVGVQSGSRMGNITIYKSDLDIKATGVGVGSESGNTTSSIIKIYGKEVNQKDMCLKVDGAKTAIGANDSGRVKDITLSKCAVIDLKTSTGVGIGTKAASSEMGDIEISESNVKVEDGSAGLVGIGSVGKLGTITLKNSIVKVSKTAVGIGSTADNSGKEISITSSKIELSGITEVGIGAGGSSGKVGNISIDDCEVVKISGGTSSIGIGSKIKSGDITINGSKMDLGGEIGIGGKGEVGAIKISATSGKIVATSVGIGFYSSSSTKSSSIEISPGSKLEISGCKLGIGAYSGARAGTINITSSEVKLSGASSGTTTGIGAGGDGSSGNITISGSKIGISGFSDAGIGDKNGKSGTITIKNTSEIIISGASTGIGRKVTIKIENSKVGISGASTGIGGESGSITISDCAGINIKSSTLGIGSSGTILISKSNVLISGSSTGIGNLSTNSCGNITISSCNKVIITASSIGIGAGTSGTINISSSNVKASVNSGGICIGGTNSVGAITLSGSTADIGGGAIGIGGNKTIEDITISSSRIIVGSASSVGIGSVADNSTKKIDIEDSEVKITGSGVGIGTISKIGDIKLSSSKAFVKTSNTAVGSGAYATCGNITLLKSTVSLESTESGTGLGSGTGSQCGNISITGGSVKAVVSGGNGAAIGGFGTAGTITISSAIIDASTSGNGACIGGKDGNVGNITIISSRVKTGSVNGMGIGGNKINNNAGVIKIKDSELDMSITGSGTGIGGDTGTISKVEIEKSAVKITGGSGNGVGIGTRGGVISGIELNDNSISILKGAGSSGAGIGSGSGGDAGNINLNRNKIVVSTGNGAGIGSGSNGEVTGTITINDGVIVAKSVNGSCIGAGSGGSVGYVKITDGKINATTTGTGSCIAAGSTLEINQGEFVCKTNGSGKGMYAPTKLAIDTGDMYISSNSGDGMYGGELIIADGKIEVVSGANAINGSTVRISRGVVKAKGGTKDINGSNITITRNANVQAYNNKTNTVKCDGYTVTQKKLSTDLWRHNEGTVWLNGDSGDTIKTDSSGDVYFWYNKDRDSALTFEMDGKQIVIWDR